MAIPQDATENMALSSSVITPDGKYIKYFTHQLVGMAFVQRVFYSYKEINTELWVTQELDDNIKASRLILPNRERYEELHERKSQTLSTEYLAGLLLVPAVNKLVQRIICKSPAPTGELMLMIYDHPKKPRVYKVTNTFLMDAVYFTLDSKINVSSLKKLGSISNRSLLRIEESLEGEMSLVSDVEIRGIKELEHLVISEYEKYFKLDTIR